MRLVRFEDVYLYRFDGYGVPEWVPRDEATRYPTSKMAHAMKRIARQYEGDARNIVVVKLRGASPQVDEQKGPEK
jgi:hypothetical protein